MGEAKFRSTGDVLRALRVRAGFATQAALAAKLHITPVYVGHLETGRRVAPQALAKAIDEMVGSHGLLIDLWNADRSGGDGDVYRRVLFNGLAAIGAVGIAAPSVFAESVRMSLAARLGGSLSTDEWTELAAEYGHRYNATAPASVAKALSGELLVLQDHLDPDKPALCAVAARLVSVYASAVASAGDPAGSRRWYRVAKAAAAIGGDKKLSMWVRGREAFRYAFDGAAQPAEILTLARDVPTVEAHLARAHAHSYLGNKGDAHDALHDAEQTYTALGEQDPHSMYDMQDWRFTQSAALVHARTGNANRAQRLLDAAPATDLPRFRVHTEVYRALAESRAGDPASARARARSAIASIPTGQRSVVLTRIADEI